MKYAKYVAPCRRCGGSATSAVVGRCRPCMEAIIVRLRRDLRHPS
jgi:hypothetical protein